MGPEQRPHEVPLQGNPFTQTPVAVPPLFTRCVMPVETSWSEDAQEYPVVLNAAMGRATKATLIVESGSIQYLK